MDTITIYDLTGNWEVIPSMGGWELQSATGSAEDIELTQGARVYCDGKVYDVQDTYIGLIVN